MSETAVPTTTLLDALPDKTVLGALPGRVTGVAYDSRKVAPGELFVAISGFKQDGRRFAADAVGRGAAVVVAEGADPLPGSATPRIIVPSSREALARLADAYSRSSLAPAHRGRHHRDERQDDAPRCWSRPCSARVAGPPA